MPEKTDSSKSLLFLAALVLCAGALGSFMTLLATDNLHVPVIFESGDQIATIPDSGVGESSVRLLQKPTVDNGANRLNPNDESDAQFAEDIQQASEERAQLAKVLAQLTRQVESLESDVTSIGAMAALDNAAQAAFDQPETPDFGGFGQPLEGQDRIDTLVSAGIDLQSAQALQDRQDQYQLARLELFDLAEREGWIDSEQFSDRLTQLNDQRPDLRDELGDEAYDRYLFEAGRNNRVIIASIITGSAAEVAGLATGDIVNSYAGERIFSTRDLQSATRAGVRGESVSMNVDRQGQRLFFDIQRGPMGVTLNQDQQNPS